MLALVYRALNGSAPTDICDLLVERDCRIDLRGNHYVTISSVDTTRTGKKCIVFILSAILVANYGTHYRIMYVHCLLFLPLRLV